MKTATIRIKKLHPAASLPRYAHGAAEDAGMDLASLHEVILEPGVPQLVKTGIAIELPPGYEAQIRSRSGLVLKHNVCVANAPATVDPGYRGDIGVILLWGGNHPNDTHYGRTWDSLSDNERFGAKKAGFIRYRIPAGSRIAQMVIAEYVGVNWEEGELTDTARGVNGFGSTGVGNAPAR